MSLSPIKMFESSQSSLAQILAGGNQSVMSIMDKAIQIGRDMSNKQLSQEKDLLAMRHQETAMFQRRAENLQQNNEDAINFSRRAFESDRKFGLDVAQEARAGVKDVFAMGDASARTALAERGVEVAEGNLGLRKTEAETEAAAAKRNADYYANTYGAPAASAEAPATPAEVLAPPASAPVAPIKTSVGAIVSRLANDPASLFGGATKPPAQEPAPTAAAAAPNTQQAAPNDSDLIKLYRDQERMESDYAGTKDPVVRSRIALLLGEVKGRIASIPKPSSRAAKTPEAIELEKLRLEAARRKDVKDFTIDIVSSNPKAFGAAASGETLSLRKFAAENNMKPEDALWSKKFETYFGAGADKLRQRILDGQIEQEAREVAAINASASEQAYVDAQTGIGENEKELRRQLYRKRKGATGAAPAAGGGSGDPIKDLIGDLP